MKSRNLKAMLLGVAFAASLTFAGTQPQMPFAPLLEVHAASYQDVELDSKYDFEKASVHPVHPCSVLDAAKM